MDSLTRLRKRAASVSIDSLNPFRTTAIKLPRLDDQQPTFLPEPKARRYSDGPERQKEEADCVRKEYLPWLEWKVKEMTASERAVFLDEYADRNAMMFRAVLAYWSEFPQHIPTGHVSSIKADREKRGMNPKLDPMKCPKNRKSFPRACRGEPVFGPREREVEDVGPKGETLSKIESLPEEQGLNSPLDGEIVKGVARRFIERCWRLGFSGAKDGE